MPTLECVETQGPESLVRSFSVRALKGRKQFHFANCRREFHHLGAKNSQTISLGHIGPTGRSVVERVQITAKGKVSQLIIDRSILVVRVREYAAWDDTMRRITEAVRDLSNEDVVVEISTPTPQACKA
jgi:hypothetical protein